MSDACFETLSYLKQIQEFDKKNLFQNFYSYDGETMSDVQSNKSIFIDGKLICLSVRIIRKFNVSYTYIYRIYVCVRDDPPNTLLSVLNISPSHWAYKNLNEYKTPLAKNELIGTIREVVDPILIPDLSNIILEYLLPPPPLPFIDQLLLGSLQDLSCPFEWYRAFFRTPMVFGKARNTYLMFYKSYYHLD